MFLSRKCFAYCLLLESCPCFVKLRIEIIILNFRVFFSVVHRTIYVHLTYSQIEAVLFIMFYIHMSYFASSIRNFRELNLSTAYF